MKHIKSLQPELQKMEEMGIIMILHLTWGGDAKMPLFFFSPLTFSFPEESDWPRSAGNTRDHPEHLPLAWFTWNPYWHDK